jgi:divalent metal cation (Fe/Co/Zn/Cd) transporter
MADAAALTRRGLLLEYLTLGWNVVGTGVLLATAVAADSIALLSFGLDSMIEVIASLVVIWQLRVASFDSLKAHGVRACTRSAAGRISRIRPTV